MKLKEVKENLRQTIAKGGNPKIVEQLEKKLDILKKKEINKKI